MARNRKRAKERRRAEALSTRPGDLLSPSSRRPGASPEARRNAPAGQPRASERATSADRPGPIGSPDLISGGDPVGAPDPIAHAAPDAELAAAQLSFGAPDITGELDAPAEEDLAELAEASGSDQSVGSGPASANGAGAVGVPPRADRAVGLRVSPLERLLTFMRGSWAELHRVQWPDRRQVIQATGVVIGFVIVAGVFLGLSDLAASHLMDWILK